MFSTHWVMSWITFEMLMLRAPNILKIATGIHASEKRFIIIFVWFYRLQDIRRYIINLVFKL